MKRPKVSLIEILILLSILAILAAVVGPQIAKMLD